MPLVGFIYSGLLGRYFGRALSSFFSTFTVFVSFFLSIFAFYEVIICNGGPVTISLFNWIYIGDITVYFGLLFDNLTCVMLLIVTGISSLVHLYSIGYMSNDPHITRFMSYLSLFTFFMLILVTADNFVQMFIGWECVGLCSYLLINFWFTRILANKAALKAMIMNRIADVFFIFGIIIILFTFKTTNYTSVFFLSDFVYNGPDYFLANNFHLKKPWFLLDLSHNISLFDLSNYKPFSIICPDYFKYEIIKYPVSFNRVMEFSNVPTTMITARTYVANYNLINCGYFEYIYFLKFADPFEFLDYYDTFDAIMYRIRFINFDLLRPSIQSTYHPWLYSFEFFKTVAYDHYMYEEVPTAYEYMLVWDKDEYIVHGPGLFNKVVASQTSDTLFNFFRVLHAINRYIHYDYAYNLDIGLYEALNDFFDFNNSYASFYSLWISKANFGGYYYNDIFTNMGTVKMFSVFDYILPICENNYNLYDYFFFFETEPLLYPDYSNLPHLELRDSWPTHSYKYMNAVYPTGFHMLDGFDVPMRHFDSDVFWLNDSILGGIANGYSFNFVDFHIVVWRDFFLHSPIANNAPSYLDYNEFVVQYNVQPDLFADILKIVPIHRPIEDHFFFHIWFNPPWMHKHFNYVLSYNDFISGLNYIYSPTEYLAYSKAKSAWDNVLLSLPFYRNFVFFGYTFDRISLVCFFLFIGSVGKSAQLGLHTWLPDAMEGPTPVSSLLHAATMVTAGVFLLIRSAPLFELSSNVLVLVAFLGGVTAFFSAIVGVFQYDVKKIIAYSTCSQLGYMFFSCGLSNYQAALFHLFNHAFFKALLFLSAGSIIHALCDEQDMRRMGGLVNFLPFTYLCFLIGSLAIMGFPFLTGFYSKDLVLEFAFSRYIIDASFIYFLGTTAAFFTAVYSIRLILFVFFYNSNTFRSFVIAHESDKNMTLSMFLLALASVFVGFLFSDIMSGLDHISWSNSAWYDSSCQLDNEFLHPVIKNLPTMLSLLGLFLGLIISNYITKISSSKNSISAFGIFSSLYNKVSAFFYNAGFFNYIYNEAFLKAFEFSYESSNKYMDKGFIEFFGPFGLYKLFKNLNDYFRNTSPVVIFFDVGYMFFCLIIFFIFLLLHSKIFLFLLSNLGLIPLSVLILFLGRKSEE